MHTGAANATVQVDLERIRHNLRGIRRQVRVDVLAVLKANAYGLGAATIAAAIADLVDGFCFFSLSEAADADAWRRWGKPVILLGPPQSLDPRDYVAVARPAVFTVEQAQLLRAADPLLCVDTGMQRFACPTGEVHRVVDAGGIREAFTHGTRVEHARMLRQLFAGTGIRLHAAASALLGEPEAYLDAVRPGLAMYHGAITVRAPLVEVRRTTGPLGYGGVQTQRHGVILCGYASGLRSGPCIVNGRPRRILEVGMQSAYVEVGEEDRAGDQVTLLGETPTAQEVAAAWGSTPQEVLLRLSAAGPLQYLPPAPR